MLPGSYPVVFRFFAQLNALLMVSGNASNGGFVPGTSAVIAPKGLADASKPDRDGFATDYMAHQPFQTWSKQ